ncbi:hypothetical protein PTI98_000734 [Pleurotus ostreatus]|nr:hypothetical protein PTI98_000734 [Pleurotus ostreatus]
MATALETDTEVGEGRRVDDAQEDPDATDPPASTDTISPAVLPPTPHLFLDIPTGTIPPAIGTGVQSLSRIPTLPTRTSVQAYLTAQLQQILTALVLNRLHTVRKWVFVGVFGVLNASSSAFLRNGGTVELRLELSVGELERARWDLEAYVDGLKLRATSPSMSPSMSPSGGNEDEDEGENANAPNPENVNEDANANANWADWAVYMVLEAMIFVQRVIPAL